MRRRNKHKKKPRSGRSQPRLVEPDYSLGLSDEIIEMILTYTINGMIRDLEGTVLLHIFSVYHRDRVVPKFAPLVRLFRVCRRFYEIGLAVWKRYLDSRTNSLYKGIAAPYRGIHRATREPKIRVTYCMPPKRQDIYPDTPNYDFTYLYPATTTSSTDWNTKMMEIDINKTKL